jgi:S1-C subfamily serine protease
MIVEAERDYVLTANQFLRNQGTFDAKLVGRDPTTDISVWARLALPSTR